MRTILNMKPGGAGLRLYEQIKAKAPRAVYWPAFAFERSKQYPVSRETILRGAEEGALLILVSPTTVCYMEDILPLLGPTVSFAAVGEPTARALARHLPDSADIRFPHGSSLESGSELLFHQLSEQGLPSKAVVIRAETGREFLINALRQAGCEVSVAPLYARIPFDAAQDEREWLGEGAAPVVYLTSTDSADILLRNIDEKFRPWLADADFVTLHPRIKNHLNELGFKKVHLVDSKDPEISEKLLALACDRQNV